MAKKFVPVMASTGGLAVVRAFLPRPLLMGVMIQIYGSARSTSP